MMSSIRWPVFKVVEEFRPPRLMYFAQEVLSSDITKENNDG